ncbi:hypothetical protein [Nakamurella endophytica]|uniref:Uncharacterized protein n=1 Tax=Nakamurella endophytica TaxID=1748367 RepID=A0A917WGP9_9ACTN|nr:hypothetical protein [Nakamurella endophytica]GGM02763.1 hypothetical protein GCM10011594_23580 [Nakamurella endophytica]
MADGTGARPVAPARRVNVLGVVLGLVFLTVASAGLTGDMWWIFSAATKWIVAGVVAVAGLLLLLSALPGRRRN